MKSGKILFLLLALSQGAWAQVYKSIDSAGHVTFSDRPSNGAVKIDIPPAPPSPPPPKAVEDVPAAESSESAVPESGASDKLEQKRNAIDEQIRQEAAALNSARAALEQMQGKSYGGYRPSQEDNDLAGRLTDEVNEREIRLEELKRQQSEIK